MKTLIAVLLAFALVGCADTEVSTGATYRLHDHDYFPYEKEQAVEWLRKRGHDPATLQRYSVKPSSFTSDGVWSVWSEDAGVDICVAYHPKGEWHDCWQVVPEHVVECPDKVCPVVATETATLDITDYGIASDNLIDDINTTIQ